MFAFVMTMYFICIARRPFGPRAPMFVPRLKFVGIKLIRKFVHIGSLGHVCLRPKKPFGITGLGYFHIRRRERNKTTPSE